MLNLSPLIQYITAIVLVGGGATAYNSFQNTKTKFEMERLIENKMDSIPHQTAAILMPSIRADIKETMVTAGLVDYELIFKSDSLHSANLYTKIQASSVSLAKAALKLEIATQKDKFYDELFAITIGTTTVIFEWYYNPNNQMWELKELK